MNTMQCKICIYKT